MRPSLTTTSSPRPDRPGALSASHRPLAMKNSESPLPPLRRPMQILRFPSPPLAGGDAEGRGGSAACEPYLVVIRCPPLCHPVTSPPARGEKGSFPRSPRNADTENQPACYFLARIGSSQSIPQFEHHRFSHTSPDELSSPRSAWICPPQRHARGNLVKQPAQRSSS